MKRNTLTVFGVGVLLGAGLFGPGCGSSSSSPKDAGHDAKFDGAAGAGGAAVDGPAGYGGAAGLDGSADTGGTVVPPVDAAEDTKRDVSVPPDGASPRDVADAQIDVPLPHPDVMTDLPADRSADQGVDTGSLPPPKLDAAVLDGVTLDVSPVMLDAERLDSEIDSSGPGAVFDSGIDGAVDSGVDGSEDI
jgi:hypothetical protein